MAENRKTSSTEQTPELQRARSTLAKTIPLAGTKGEAQIKDRGFAGELPSWATWRDDIMGPNCRWVSAIIIGPGANGAVLALYVSKRGRPLVGDPMRLIGPSDDWDELRAKAAFLGWGTVDAIAAE